MLSRRHFCGVILADPVTKIFLPSACYQINFNYVNLREMEIDFLHLMSMKFMKSFGHHTFAVLVILLTNLLVFAG